MDYERKEIQGIEEVADLGSGISLCYADVNILKEQDLNARIMKEDMFEQLVQNIKKRGQLESLPYCAVVGDKVEIISGHHRIKASKEAGLKKIPILLDYSGLNRSQISAKQLAHNSISGFDDKDVLREISKLITDVDDMLEAFVDVTPLQVDEETPVVHIGSELDWKQISLTFFKHQLDDLNELVKNLDQKPDVLGVARLSDFDEFVKTIKATQKFEDVKNLSTAVSVMIDIINEKFKKDGYFDNKPYVPLSKVIGGSSVKKEYAETIKNACDKLVKEGKATTKQEALYILSKECLGE